MATVTSLYICISYIYTSYNNFNYLSSYMPIACQPFSVTCSMSLTYPYLYFFCFPISILYIFLYLSCVHLSRLSYVFSMFIFFFRLHIMSLVYVFFIFRFYDLLHSMYYHIYHFLYIVLSYIFLYDLVLSYTLHLRFYSDYRIDIHDRFKREPRPVCHSIAM